jgi:hypothetical protein
LAGAVVDPEITASTEVIVTFFLDWGARTKTEERLSLDALAERIRTTTAPAKEDLPWLKFARFGSLPTKHASLRWNGNVGDLSGIVGEYDGGKMRIDEAVERLDKAGITALVYSSPSHMWDGHGPRWRVCCPFSAPLPPDQHYRMMSRVNGVLGGVLASESWTLSQSYYYGTVEGRLEPRIEIVDGTATLDQCDELDEIAVGKPNGSANGLTQTAAGDPEAPIDDIVAALEVAPNDDLDWTAWNTIGMAAWRASGGAEDAFVAFDKWSQKSAKYDTGETRFRWDHYKTSPPCQVDFGTLIYLARQAQHSWTPPSRQKNRPAPIIRLEPGQRESIVDALEAALIAADCGLYCHGSRVVEIAWQQIAVADGRKDWSLRLSPITELGLVERLSRAAVFEKWNNTAKQWVTADAPKDVAQTYLERSKKRLPPLLGVVTAPTLRHDGSILQIPGYDERMAIFFEPNGVTFPAIPDRPTKADALVALDKLKDPVRKYQFSGAGRAVALSNIITAVVRPAVPAAPGHGFDAPIAGSGKTKLADTAAVIATGHRAAALAVMSGRNAKDELYKQLAAAVLAGDQMIVLDNLETIFDIPLLCQIITEQKVTIRHFGRLKNAVAACAASVSATGNNLAIEGDNMRRWMMARLVIDDERPELRAFDFDPVEEAQKRRPDLVSAALTIVRAYRVAGERKKLPALGSFEKWSRWVREALVWLGEDDPVATMEAVRAADPAAAKRRALMEAWPFVTETSVSAVIARACERLTEADEADAGLANPDLHAAVIAVAPGKDSGISAERLGWWLRRNKDQVVAIKGRGRYRFEQVGEKGRQGITWLLRCLDEPPMGV